MPHFPVQRVPFAALIALLILALSATVVLALSVGASDISLWKVFASLLQPLGISLTPAPDTSESITILQLRLPRLVLGLLIGGALAQAGAAMQAVFRNPLADPGLIGVSSGAALAAIVVIVLGHRLGWTALPMHWLLPLASFAGGAAVTWLVVRLASRDGVARPSTLLLAGLAINAVTGAGIGFLTQIADAGALRSLSFWMFGSLGKAGWPEILAGAPLLLAVLLWLPREARALNALLLGEAEAGHLGVDVEKLKRRVLLLIVLAVGVSVALAGIIGFVGLIVPHLIRLACGPDHRLLLPGSALLGAVLLSLADTAARVVLVPAEIPVGILTALIGGPFFLILLLRYQHRVETL
jgi:iron complex transport system permease protein